MRLLDSLSIVEAEANATCPGIRHRSTQDTCSGVGDSEFRIGDGHVRARAAKDCPTEVTDV